MGPILCAAKGGKGRPVISQNRKRCEAPPGQKHRPSGILKSGCFEGARLQLCHVRQEMSAALAVEGWSLSLFSHLFRRQTRKEPSGPCCPAQNTMSRTFPPH